MGRPLGLLSLEIRGYPDAVDLPALNANAAALTAYAGAQAVRLAGCRLILYEPRAGATSESDH